jgi:hypothetical protein
VPLRAAFRSVIDDGEEINLALSDEVRVRKSAKDAWSEHFAERFVFHLAAPNLTTEAVNPQLSPHVNGTFVAQSGPARRNLLYRLMPRAINTTRLSKRPCGRRVTCLATACQLGAGTQSKEASPSKRSDREKTAIRHLGRVAARFIGG